MKKLPIWNKTKFYCFLSGLLDVSSGRNLGQAWESQLPAILSERRSPEQDSHDESPGSFRLDKYRITVSGANQISWQSLEGMDRVVGGQCIIHSGILFIGPKDSEAGTQPSHEFFKEINELLPWKRTKIWGSSFALRPCESPPQTERLYEFWGKARRHDTKYAGEKLLTPLWKECQDGFRSLWPSGSKLKEAWGRRPRLLSSSNFRGLSSHFHGLLRVRILGILPPLMRRVLGFIRNLYLIPAPVNTTRYLDS